MRLDWLDHLKATVGREEFPADKHLSSMARYVEGDKDDPETVFHTHRIATFDLHMGVRQRVMSNISADELDALRLKTAKMMADIFHGPIIAELREIQIELYDSGMLADDAILERIEGMIKTLKLEK